MNTEMPVVDNELPIPAPQSPYKMTKKIKRRGRDIMEVYPDKYTRLENGQIIKVKVDAVVSA
jgi:hypothetical protein